MENPTHIDLILEWYERSRSSVFDQFIYLWISFNAWLSMIIGTEESDRAKINWFKEQERYRNYFLEAIKVGKELYRTSDFFAKNGVWDAKKRKRFHAKGAMDFGGIVELIYIVRCNLFHGSKNRDDIVDRTIVELSCKLLTAIYEPIVVRLRN
jgi:hypothetical protein